MSTEKLTQVTMQPFVYTPTNQIHNQQPIPPIHSVTAPPPYQGTLAPEYPHYQPGGTNRTVIVTERTVPTQVTSDLYKKCT